jgi:hypothetical protein
MESLSPINVRFDADSRAWIKRVAHALNWSENKVIRECVGHTRMVIEHPELTEVPNLLSLSRALPKKSNSVELP